MQLQKAASQCSGTERERGESGSIRAAVGREGGREGGETVERERDVPAAVPVRVEVVLVGKQRRGEALAAALPPLRSTSVLVPLANR